MCSIVTSHRTHHIDLITVPTYWSKVKSHSIILLVVLNDFSAICTTVILKWLQFLIAAVGLMLDSVVLGPVIAACSYIFNYNHLKTFPFEKA